MPNYTYTVERSREQNVDYTTVRITVGGGEAVAKLFFPQPETAKLESFSTPANGRGGGLSYALVKLLLEQCPEGTKCVRVDGVHGYLHYTLKNLGMSMGAMRADPTYKGEKLASGRTDPGSFPKLTRDYASWWPDKTLWLAQLKLVEKGISLASA